MGVSEKRVLVVLLCALIWISHDVHCFVGPMRRSMRSCRTPRRRRHFQAASDKRSDTNDSVEDDLDKKVYKLPRLYVGPNIRLRNDSQFALTTEQAHYVTTVMRIGRNKFSYRNNLRVFDGRNGEWLAQIQVKDQEEANGKKRKRRDNVGAVTAQCICQLRPQHKQDGPGNALEEPWLFFAPLKKHRVKLILEKCTELGAGLFVPILTERADASSVRDVCQNLKKLAAQCIEASEQSERMTVPPLSISCHSNAVDVKDPWDLSSLLREWALRDGVFRDRHLLLCRERTVDRCVPVLKQLELLSTDKSVTGVAFVIGPEGGWTRSEEALCDEYSKRCSNIQCVSLGSLILRAETAAITAIVACALAQDFYSNANESRS